jgi:hypothetical protein
METGMSNEAVAALSPGSRYCSFRKTVMADKVWKILDKLKPGLRRPQSPLGYTGKMEYIYS